MAEVDLTDRRRQGELVVSAARRWIGTPYSHQASCRGAGADCLGLLRGVWRELKGLEPEATPPYTPDWAEAGTTEDMLNAANRNLIPVHPADAIPGDVLVLRMVDTGVAKHIGILARAHQGHLTLIHAYSGHGVVESPLTPSWLRRVAGAFRIPF